MISLQAQIKHNYVDMNNYLDDLVSWSNETTKKEKNIKSTTNSTKNLPPVRNKIDIEQELKEKMPNVPELEKFKRDNTAMPRYYKAWDKYAKQLDECLDN